MLPEPHANPNASSLLLGPSKIRILQIAE